MTSTIEEFRDILAAETLVDMAKLRSSSRHGIPHPVRPDVWKYLLNVQRPDKTLADQSSLLKTKYRSLMPLSQSNMASSQSNSNANGMAGEHVKRLRNECLRYQTSRTTPSRRIHSLPSSSSSLNLSLHRPAAPQEFSCINTQTLSLGHSPISFVHSSSSSPAPSSPSSASTGLSLAKHLASQPILPAGSDAFPISETHSNVSPTLSVSSQPASMSPSLMAYIQNGHSTHRSPPVDGVVFNSPLASNLSQTLENVVSTYLTAYPTISYTPSFVSLCGLLCFVMKEEEDVYYCFESLKHLMDESFHTPLIPPVLTTFQMLFRTCLPDLYSHFEEEELECSSWSKSWFDNLLSKELPLECALRLWDTYFSTSQGLSLHAFVCVSILDCLKENLEELEQSEIRAILNKLPLLDMDQVIGKAFNLMNDIQQRSLNE